MMHLSPIADPSLTPRPKPSFVNHSIQGNKVATAAYLIAVGCFFCALRPLLATEAFSGQKTSFHGFVMYEDRDLGRRVVIPEQAAEGNPWIWRARFWGHEPQFDLAMLRHGFHVASCDVSNLFGSPKAVERGNEFYRDLVKQHGFSPKPVLEGMSRGGLFIYNWAAANPNKVTAIYGDAPVMDFKSWPGNQPSGQPPTGAWKSCLDAYGLTPAQAADYQGIPLNSLGILAQAGIPLIHVVGDADTVVPVSENTAIAEKRYRAHGGTMKVIHKPGVGHHPHSLKDPTPLVDFVLDAWNNTMAQGSSSTQGQ
jgi:pimeloyl-ACP methyl ester carboxylesterase